MSLLDDFNRNLNDHVARYPGSLSELARCSGYSVSYISHVLSGRKNNPTIFFVENVAAVLGVTPNDLLNQSKP